ncbi:hypothetical protein OG394_23805 [Kribbella sp. NBC_01245]|uniref:hypothetical protein n=1 Tax=Kribbella sp. NBC_01245 TaxID=2903578 RepID=UPI002E2CC504|nr:hypothetical protein [Kribbella sp. NBC_01245]
MAAVSDHLDGVSGHYFADNAEAIPVTQLPSMTPVGPAFMNAVAPYALNEASADHLWEESLRLTHTS